MLHTCCRVAYGKAGAFDVATLMHLVLLALFRRLPAVWRDDSVVISCRRITAPTHNNTSAFRYGLPLKVLGMHLYHKNYTVFHAFTEHRAEQLY